MLFFSNLCNFLFDFRTNADFSAFWRPISVTIASIGSLSFLSSVSDVMQILPLEWLSKSIQQWSIKLWRSTDTVWTLYHLHVEWFTRWRWLAESKLLTHIITKSIRRFGFAGNTHILGQSESHTEYMARWCPSSIYIYDHHHNNNRWHFYNAFLIRQTARTRAWMRIAHAVLALSALLAIEYFSFFDGKRISSLLLIFSFFFLFFAFLYLWPTRFIHALFLEVFRPLDFVSIFFINILKWIL